MTVELGASLDYVLGLGWAGRLGISLVGADPIIGRCPMLSCVTLSESGDEDLERLIDNGYRMDMRMPGI